MIRRFLSACLFLLVFGAVLIAAEIKGRIIKVDPSNRKITVHVEDGDRELTLNKDARILGPKGNLKDGLAHKVFRSEKALKKGIPATIITETKDDAERVTEIKLGGTKKKSEP
jgi:hypothetical protein